MKEVEIRFATLEDLENIQKLNLDLFKKEFEEYDKSLNLEWTFGEEGTNYFKDRISKEDGCVFVAIVENKIVGYLAGGLAEAESYRIIPKTAELENMYVLKEYRRLGIGSKLYNEFVKWCKEKGVKLLRVEANVQNELGLKFYRRKGFKDYILILEQKI